MLLRPALPFPARSGILFTGFLTGILWAALLHYQPDAIWTLYALVLVSGFNSVLAFTVTRFRTLAPWLWALSVLPFLALITGWLHWNFATRDTANFAVRVGSVVFFWLFLLMPFLQVRAGGEKGATAIIAALWNNTFTLAATALLTGLFWLFLLLWSQLFGLIAIHWFDRLFFDNVIFPPVATGMAIAAGIVLCRSLPAAGEVFRRFVTLLASAVLPAHALISLLFLASLPFTGLAIIPGHLSTAVLLTIMSLIMAILTAVTGSPGARTLNYPGWLAKLIGLAQCLSPLFVLLASYALWLRVAQYGWTMDRIHAAVLIALMLVWSLGIAGLTGRRALAHNDRLSVLMLSLIALFWLLLHSPLLDPYRITINQQRSQLERGIKHADTTDLYLFSQAGRRGHQLLLTLQKHPQWLDDAQGTRTTLAQMLASTIRQPPAAPAESKLRQSVKLRPGSMPLPESWWQRMVENKGYMINGCLLESAFCLAWLMDLNDDGRAEVLLYDRGQQKIQVFVWQQERWQPAGEITPASDDKEFARLAEHGKTETVQKPWRDLLLNGKRYPVHYYGVD
ncbi:DUF4153 domain-containing protein [[Erwinia] mediterraneensis]|uniref:DUF4153 domain-containing protein n=1 Tax=[Erwinia] mediterraneensis TaxID=2161819 RepID=UPI001031D5FA|nr:DUF4153 domain-containing protein [[Erwinia] mediterraneensis]